MVIRTPRTEELEVLYSLIKPEPHHVVLDALAGSGFASGPLIGKVASITAVDVDQRPEELPSHISYARNNIKDLGLKDNSFDVVLAHTGFHHVGDGDSKLQEKALRELYRVLKPAGTIVISDLQGESSASEFNDKCVKNHGNKCQWLTTGKIKEALEKIGFKDVVSRKKDVSWNFSTYEDMNAFTAKIFKIPENKILSQLQLYNLLMPNELIVKLPFWYAKGVKK